MRVAGRILNAAVLTVTQLAAAQTNPQQITAAGKPAQLEIRAAGQNSIRITLRPIGVGDTALATPALVDRELRSPVISVRLLAPGRRVATKVGSLNVLVHRDPLTIAVTNALNEPVQEIAFADDGTVRFKLDGRPVLGMGEGGPRPQQGRPWRTQPIQFDRSGFLDTMEPRWQSDAYGSRNPVAMLAGTGGWGIFMPTPWAQVDLTRADTGVFVPWIPTDAERAPQNQRNQQSGLGKGKPPVDKVIPGVYDIFVFDAHEPAAMMKDFAAITGPAALPPKWALGYMQSHRTLEDETQLIGIIDTFRAKKIPVDAVIYLGTGFTPRGWNTRQPSFDFNPDVFRRDGKTVLADMHARNVKVVVHMVPWDRDKLPTLHGSIPPARGEVLDSSHIANYWKQHVGLMNAGVDAFWPDEGDWFNLFERLTRHQMYYQGPLSTRPNTRPWSLHRNGYPGVAQWGGWVWSGDTEASWKSLEGQIAVGINYGLSLGPFWGSDIAGFYANNELTGELYARWFQFGAFSPSFRSHGRNWQLRLPWGWGLSDFGPREYNNTNAPIPPGDRRNIDSTELGNATIEPVVKRYAELRYQLLPYTYTLAWEARASGMPMMRAMWLHYPNDERARGLGSQYLWGRDLLVAPVFEKGATTRAVYLPEGTWYDWWSGAREGGGQTVTRAVDLATMPIYVRAGAIIPLDPVRQYTAEPTNEPTTIRIYRGANGDYTLYDDDGATQDYLNKRGTWTRFTWNDSLSQLTVQPGAPAGFTNIVAPKAFHVEVLPLGTRKTVNYAGRLVRVTF